MKGGAAKGWGKRGDGVSRRTAEANRRFVSVAEIESTAGAATIPFYSSKTALPCDSIFRKDAENI